MTRSGGAHALIAVAGVLAVFTGCTARTPAPGSGAAPGPDDDAFATAAAVDMIAARVDDALVVSGMTWAPAATERSAMRDRAVAEPVFPALLAGRLAADQRPAAPLAATEDLPANVTVARGAGFDGGSDFHAAHPAAGAWLRLTAPVFDDERQTALIVADLRCGEGCRSGWLLLLRRTDRGTFRVTAEKVLWIG